MPFGNVLIDPLPITPPGDLSPLSFPTSQGSSLFMPNSSPLVDPFSASISIDALSSKYPAVQTLRSQLETALQQLSTANTTITDLLQERKQFQDEQKKGVRLAGVEGRYAQLVSTLASPKQPFQRPVELPFSVMWSFEDLRHDLDAAPPASNPSRPRIDDVMRNIDGTIFTVQERDETMSIVSVVYQTNIAHIKGPKPGCPPTWTYILSYHREKADTCFNELEIAKPALSLCAHRWKANYLFMHHAQNKVAAASKRGKTTATTKRKGKDTPDSSTAQPEPQVVHNSEPAQIQPPAPPLPPDTSQAPPSSPGPQSHEKRKAVDDNSRDGQPSPKKTKTINPTNATSTFNAAFALAPPPVLPPPQAAVDVSWICVNPSIENLQDAFSSEFPNIDSWSQLMKHLQQLAATNSDSSPPSDNAAAFLARIENADPNSPDLTEDNDNEQWGHSQFTAGSLTIDTALDEWASIGSTAFACRLLAAFIKTCRVARQLCFCRRRPEASYLSDVYLERAVKRMWDMVKDITVAGLVPPLNEAPTPETNDANIASKTRLQALQVPQLNKWIDDSNISRTGLKRKPNKTDLINLILGANILPSNEDLQMLAALRRPSAKRT